jgi:hypothetical protein
MKKIFALLLAICCIFACVSCADEEEQTGPEKTDVQIVSEIMNASVPTRAEVTSVQKTRYFELKSLYTLETGVVDGLRTTQIISEEQSLRDVEGGNYNNISTKKTSEWYIEGKGYYLNSRSNDPEAAFYAPTEGFINLNLSEELFDSCEYNAETGTLEIDVSWKNSNAVLGGMFSGEDKEPFEYDTHIKIVTAGGRVSELIITYTIDEHDVGDFDNSVTIGQMTVTVSAIYYYNTQQITLKGNR